MTYYFNRIDQSLTAADMATGEGLKRIEHELVRDVTICAESPGCPEDIRDKIHALVLKYGVVSQPINAEPRDLSPRAHREELYRLSAELHGVFHTLCQRRLEDFSDNPRLPVLCLEGRGEARREALLADQD